MVIREMRSNEYGELENFYTKPSSDDALEKVRAGLTTLDEVRRVLGSDFIKGVEI